MEETKKIRSICIDTLTGIQNEEYMTNSRKPGHDQWLDYGKDIWKLISFLQEKKFNTIMILGEPATGKSTGMRNLPTRSNIWVNADMKDPSWLGGREEYGKLYSPILPYHLIPKSYDDIYRHINLVESKDLFEKEKFAILTGHIEDYKSGFDNKRRLKILGKIGTKMQLEGRLNNVFYTNVIREGNVNRYVLETQTDGTNTARSPMGLFEPIIDNDYQFIIEKLMNY
jgi:hypothetical protein